MISLSETPSGAQGGCQVRQAACQIKTLVSQPNRVHSSPTADHHVALSTVHNCTYFPAKDSHPFLRDCCCCFGSTMVPASPTPTHCLAECASDSKGQIDHTRTIAARQELRTVTQTVRLPETTLVSEVTLGATAVSAQESTTSESPLPAIYASDGSLTNEQIGGIIGGVLGFVFVVLALWCFLVASRRQKRRKHRSRDWDYSYDTSEVSSETPPTVQVEPEPERRWPWGFWAGYPPRSPRRQHSTMYMPMPPPPPPAYPNVKRAPPWEPRYSGPKRNLRGY